MIGTARTAEMTRTRRMSGMKMIAFGFLLTFFGLGVLAILAIPGASFILANAFNNGFTLGGLPINAASSMGQTFAVFDPSFITASLTFLRVGEIVAFVALLAGLGLGVSGMVRKE